VNGARTSNWLRASTRAAIHTRDNWTCAWCGASVDTHGFCELGGHSVTDLVLTVDHLHPHCMGGTNAPWNLVTACWECNTNRGVASSLAMLAWLDAEGRDTVAVRKRLLRARIDLTPFRTIGRRLERERPLWYARHKKAAASEGYARTQRQLRFGFQLGVVLQFGIDSSCEPLEQAAAVPF
jgi:hypothetical protein